MSDYSAAQPAGGSFSVGAVLKRSFGTYFANLVPFTALAFILYLPTLLYGFTTTVNLEDGTAPGDPTADIVVALISFVLTYILIGALVYGTVQHLSGQRPSLGAIVTRGMSMIGPVVVIAILLSLMVGIGFALLVVPGLFLMTAFAAVIPAAVVERAGIIGSFKRSWDLTRGYRWPVFGVLFVLIVIVLLFSFALGAAGGIVAFTTGSFTLLLIADYLASAISGALMAVAIAVMYHDLRIAKEGVSTAQIAAVFD